MVVFDCPNLFGGWDSPERIISSKPAIIPESLTDVR